MYIMGSFKARQFKLNFRVNSDENCALNQLYIHCYISKGYQKYKQL